jgi:hypothetical protein
MNIHDIAKQIRSFADELEAKKPEQPKPFTLPTPPPGMRWHREDWTAEMMPPGTRPLTKGEVRLPGDSIFPTNGSDSWRNKWQTVDRDGWVHPQNPCREGSYHSRTTRPLLFTHAGHEWTWHRAGDPCPCDEKRKTCTLYKSDLKRDLSHIESYGEEWNWGERPDERELEIIGWRYADAEKPDPYAELKKAHAEGKVLQVNVGTTNKPEWEDWDSKTSPEFGASLCDYRIKPDEIPWIEWHGGECPLKDEEVGSWEVRYSNDDTMRLTIPPSKGTGWKGGDLYKAYRVLKTREPKPNKVKLGPEDVPPNSVFRLHDADIGYEVPCEVSQEGVTFADDTGNFTKTWEELRHWQINRPRHRDQDGNPTLWEPCEK